MSLRIARLVKGYTQQKLADKIGVSVTMIRKYESGKVIPKFSIVQKICKALEISLNDIEI